MTLFPPRSLMPLLIVLSSAVLGAAGMALLDPFGSPGPLSLPALAGHGSPRQPLDAQHVYDRLLPSVLDVTAALRFDDETAEGTGFVIDASRRLILTNNHVIKDATSITATLASTGKAYPVRVVGTDTAADVAVLALEGAPRLTPAPIGDSAAVDLGDQVLVIGNQAGQGGPPTIAPGIINSLDRTIEAADGSAGFTETLHHMLQTSAQIEPGDSGGPLVDSSGRVIGVDTAASTGAGTAGFAIPVDSALGAARRISSGRAGPGITLGTSAFLGVIAVPAAPENTPGNPQSSSLTDRAPSPGHPLLPTVTTGRPWKAVAEPGRRHGTPGRGAGPGPASGGACLPTAAEAVMPDPVAPVRDGALVEGVLCGTPAAVSGLVPGDVIVRAAGRAVATPRALESVIAGCEPGTELPVSWVDVGGSAHTAMIRVISAPAR